MTPSSGELMDLQRNQSASVAPARWPRPFPCLVRVSERASGPLAISQYRVPSGVDDDEQCTFIDVKLAGPIRFAVSRDGPRLGFAAGDVDYEQVKVTGDKSAPRSESQDKQQAEDETVDAWRGPSVPSVSHAEAGPPNAHGDGRCPPACTYPEGFVHCRSEGVRRRGWRRLRGRVQTRGNVEEVQCESQRERRRGSGAEASLVHPKGRLEVQGVLRATYRPQYHPYSMLLYAARRSVEYSYIDIFGTRDILAQRHGSTTPVSRTASLRRVRPAAARQLKVASLAPRGSLCEAATVQRTRLLIFKPHT
ncbi:hypothetical protein AK830_g3446 [Neonectria ditissima]|uniref:Uncharacterized protein n=1 Tax=Neonectria ditissima TaxID=78410 RepID=A0A0P7B8N4_9HYPO|nr:hypothetical protein AK830_g3446 [Neonectria ditissima]